MKLSIITTTILFFWGLPVVTHAQAPDLSLPPLPSMGQSEPITLPNMPAGEGTKITSRAAADSIDDLMPSAAKPTEVVATPPSNTPTLAPLGITSLPLSPSEPPPPAPPATMPAPDINAAAPVQGLGGIGSAINPASTPAPVVAPTSGIIPPLKPKTLEEEAAEAGIVVPPLPALPAMPSATAQALLSGQPLREDEEALLDALPEKQTATKPSYRDLPKLRSSITPLKSGYQYKRQVLPARIYRKQYSADNRHLPLAVLREDEDRHLFGAVAANDVNATRAYLERGKDINMVSPRGDTLLATAVRYGALDTARLLLARGANPNMAGSNGQAPLALAQSTGQRDMALAIGARASGYASYQPK